MAVRAKVVAARESRYQMVSSYVSALRGATGYYVGYVPESGADQVTADSFYQALKNDDAVFHAMNILALQAAGEQVVIRHHDPRVQIILQNCVNRIEDFTHARKSQIQNGVLFGLGVQRKYYQKIKLPGIKGEWNVPCRMQEVDRRRMRIEREVGDPTQAYWTLWSPEIDQYIILEDRATNPNIEDGAGIQDYCWFVNEWEELSPYFRGIGEVLYPLVYMKQKLIQYWADLSESWAKPFLTATINPRTGAATADLGSGKFTSIDARVQELLDKLDNARARHSMVLDTSDDLKIHEHGSTGNNIIADQINYINNRVQLVILGTELTTGAGSHGSYAQADVHRSMGETVIEFYRDRYESFAKKDIVQDIISRNVASFRANEVPVPSAHEVYVSCVVKNEALREEAMKERISRGRHDATKEL